MRNPFKADPTCGHGVPLIATCHKCTPRQRAAAEDQADRGGKAKAPDPRKATTGTFRTGVSGRVSKTSRRAK